MPISPNRRLSLSVSLSVPLSFSIGLNDGFYGSGGIPKIDGWLNMERDTRLTQYWTDVRKNLAEDPNHA